MKTFLFVVLPVGTNVVLAFFAFVVFPDAFKGNPVLCYSIAAFATTAGAVSVGGFLLHDIGPGGAVAALVAQAVALVAVFASIYAGFGLNKEPNISADLAVYFSIVTWTTLGYGDYQPHPSLQLLAALQAGLGYLFLGLIVGLTANWISNR